MIPKLDQTTIMLVTYRILCAFFLGFLPTVGAWASGNLLPRVSADALAVADANVVLGAGASAQVTNPASLVATESARASWAMGTAIGRVRTNYLREVDAGAALAGGYSPETSYPIIPFFAWSTPLSARAALGISLESAHGLGSDWRDHSFDQTIGPLTVDIARESELRTLRFGPALAWRLGPHTGLGLRGFVQHVEAREESDLARVEGDGFTGGVQVGLRHAGDHWGMGIAYTSRTDTKVRGDFNTNAPATPASGDATAHILLPDRLQAGIAFRVLPDVWWELDLDWLGWSYASELSIVRGDGNILNAGRTARSNDDTLSVRTGVEWRYRPGLTWRAGLGYDPNPVPDRDASPTASIVRKTRIAFGSDIKLSDSLTLGLAYQFIYGHERRVHDSVQDNLAFTTGRAFEGIYSSRSHVLGITVTGSL